MKITTRQIDDYMKKIRLLFPFLGKAEKRYLRYLRHSIDEYIDTNDPAFDELVEYFGTPREIVHEYIMNIDVDVLYRKLRTRRILLYIFIVVLIATIVVSAFKLYYYHDLYVKSLDSIPLIEETIIY